MKKIIIILVILSAPAVAMATEEKVSEADDLRRQLADTDAARAKAELDAAMLRKKAVYEHITSAYRLTDGDDYDFKTLVIKRAAKKK